MRSSLLSVAVCLWSRRRSMFCSLTSTRSSWSRCSVIFSVMFMLSVLSLESMRDTVCLYVSVAVTQEISTLTYETCIVSKRLMLSTLAAIKARSFVTSSATNSAHCILCPGRLNEKRVAKGLMEVLYCSIFVRKFRNGIWQARAMPRMALTCLKLSSVGSRAPS